MIHEVGEWVFRGAADLRQWGRAGQAVGRIWVNVSARQLASADLVARPMPASDRAPRLAGNWQPPSEI